MQIFELMSLTAAQDHSLCYVDVFILVALQLYAKLWSAK